MTATTQITTHVLNTSTGQPAVGVEFELAAHDATTDDWQVIAQGVTDADGRSGPLPIDAAQPGDIFRLKFATAAYFERQGVATFYPSVTVEFWIAAASPSYHVPLLISPFGYTTYRGS
jgi:5-hydroxyisourate hydrolase